MIRHANELKKDIQENTKTKKFQDLIFYQNMYIKNNMVCDKNTALWIFNHKDYYHTDLERKWVEEFNNKATKMYEEKGYRILGDTINWQ